MHTTTEPLTGAVASIVASAARPGEDWRFPTERRDRDEVRPTIPPRVARSDWEVGDVYLDGRTRWIITAIEDGAVTLRSANSVTASVIWTTSLQHLTPRSAS